MEGAVSIRVAVGNVWYRRPILKQGLVSGGQKYSTKRSGMERRTSESVSVRGALARGPECGRCLDTHARQSTPADLEFPVTRLEPPTFEVHLSCWCVVSVHHLANLSVRPRARPFDMCGLDRPASSFRAPAWPLRRQSKPGNRRRDALELGVLDALHRDARSRYGVHLAGFDLTLISQPKLAVGTVFVGVISRAEAIVRRRRGTTNSVGGILRYLVRCSCQTS